MATLIKSDFVLTRVGIENMRADVGLTRVNHSGTYHSAWRQIFSYAPLGGNSGLKRSYLWTESPKAELEV